MFKVGDKVRVINKKRKIYGLKAVIVSNAIRRTKEGDIQWRVMFPWNNHDFEWLSTNDIEKIIEDEKAMEQEKIEYIHKENYKIGEKVMFKVSEGVVDIGKITQITFNGGKKLYTVENERGARQFEARELAAEVVPTFSDGPDLEQQYAEQEKEIGIAEKIKKDIIEIVEKSKKEILQGLLYTHYPASMMVLNNFLNQLSTKEAEQQYKIGDRVVFMGIDDFDRIKSGKTGVVLDVDGNWAEVDFGDYCLTVVTEDIKKIKNMRKEQRYE